MSKTAVTKPAVTTHEWFETGAGGNISTPPDAEIETGYVPPGVIPKVEEFNYWFRRWDRAVRYYIQRGIPDWDALEQYSVGDKVRYVNGSITYLLVCVVAPSVGLNPLTSFDLSGRFWERWSYSNFGTSHTATDDTPIVRWRNNKSFHGNAIDRLGFFSGYETQNLHETWRGTENQGNGTVGFFKTDIFWIALVASSGAGAVGVQDPSTTTHFCRGCQLAIDTGGSEDTRLYSQNISVFNDSVDMALEFKVFTDVNINNQRMAFGLTNPGGGSLEIYGATNAFVGGVIYKGNGDANWKCVTGDGTTLGTPVDSGVVVAASSTYLIRIEWIGATMADDGVRRMRFYIGGQLVATSIANLPSSYATPLAAVSFATKRDTGATTRLYTVGPVRFSARY